MTNATLRGKPDAGNPHVRFDEGEVASAKPRRGSLLYRRSDRLTHLVLAAACTCAALTLTAMPCLTARADERVLSGYTGYFLGEKTDHVERMIDALGAHGFNAIDVKINSGKRAMDIGPSVAELKGLVSRARGVGLRMNFYLYPSPPNAQRHPEWPEHAVLPVPVDAAGQPVESAFRLSDPAVWRQLFKAAYSFAERRRMIGFASLRFDVETINAMTSYDDESWKAFCGGRPGLDVNTPASGRVDVLKAAGLADAYVAAWQDAVAKAVKAFVGELRATDPDLELGYMPAGFAGLGDVLDRVLATDRLPAWIDGWSMYNGLGYQPSVAAAAEKVRKAHPNNRYIVWLRPNSYLPKDIASSAYHGAAHTDGYSMWSLWMLDDMAKRGLGMSLPKGHTGAEYLKEFERANLALRADLSEGTIGTPNRIPFQKVEPMVAKLIWDDVRIPPLDAVSSGTASDAEIVLRERQTIFLQAQSGQPISVTIVHLSGDARPAGLQYALLSPQGRVLRNEAVTRGSKDAFSVSAPETGTYALVVTGGSGGMAWYSVRVSGGLNWAVDARKPAYLFGPQTFFVQGGATRNPVLRIQNMSADESYRIRLDGGEWHTVVRTLSSDFPLPDGLVRVDIEKLDQEGTWCQNFLVSIPGGRSPFVLPVSGRGLGSRCRVWREGRRRMMQVLKSVIDAKKDG